MRRRRRRQRREGGAAAAGRGRQRRRLQRPQQLLANPAAAADQQLDGLDQIAAAVVEPPLQHGGLLGGEDAPQDLQVAGPGMVWCGSRRVLGVAAADVASGGRRHAALVFAGGRVGLWGRTYRYVSAEAATSGTEHESRGGSKERKQSIW